MLVVTWTGMGFLAPALMLAPYAAVHGFARLGMLPADRLWPYLPAAALCCALTHRVGSRLNAHGVSHRFCNVRFENWAWIQLGLATAVYGLLWLGSGRLP